MSWSSTLTYSICLLSSLLPFVFRLSHRLRLVAEPDVLVTVSGTSRARPTGLIRSMRGRRVQRPTYKQAAEYADYELKITCPSKNSFLQYFSDTKKKTQFNFHLWLRQECYDTLALPSPALPHWASLLA